MSLFKTVTGIKTYEHLRKITIIYDINQKYKLMFSSKKAMLS